ncbi:MULTISPECIES: hypothetical protein [unclassified Ruegeria]|uniref:hypothetical protein n=1 Tax=unclassified Ruegeria TaxID=2625375 RepID=UPI0014892AE2|nr:MULTISPECIES: hypothetical protein [unclassified Ruegeria]
MKKIRLVLAGISALAAPLALAEEADNKTYLFVETATKAELQDGKLVLYGVDEEVSVFSDRPYRSAGVISRDHFFDIWSQGENSFDVDPPNAALSGEIDEESHVLIIEISSPTVDGEKVSYSYDTIQGDEVQAMDNVIMFIDSFSWRPPYTGPDGGLP